MRCVKMKKRYFTIYFTVLVILFMLGFSTQTCFAGESDASKSHPGKLIRIPASSRQDDPFEGISFPTVYKSGFDLCTNIGGQPVIFLFTSHLCSHCQWFGKIYDVIVKNYVEDGRIEAHHYDILTKDDLLTEEVETEIPEEIFELYHRGSPKDLVPYINYSCKFERVGNGYEKTKDTEAEGQEMMDVIDTLIKALSASEEKENK
jgi:thiol-disulfide isomerase/thioredoxin